MMTQDITDRDGPRISIVVPAYNREGLLGATLDSVLDQTFTDWELVVSDDGSSDATAAVAQSYADRDPRIRIVRGPNGGVARARNRGFAATHPRSEFVTFLDDDDVWERSTLASLVAVLEARPEFAAAHGLARCIDPQGELLPEGGLLDELRDRHGLHDGVVRPIDPSQPTTFAELAVHNWTLNPGLWLVRRSVLEQVGGFDPAVAPADDWDMAIRVSRYGDLGFLDQPVLRWRRHPATLTNTSSRWSHAYFAVRDKLVTSPENTPEQAEIARRLYRRMVRDRVGDARAGLGERDLRLVGIGFAKAAATYARYAKARLCGIVTT